MNATEKMMWSTYPVATLKGEATGFIVIRHDKDAPEGVVPVLFTSAHFLETLGKGPFVIGFRVPDATGDAEVSLLAFIPGQSGARDDFYVRHPEHDLAAVTLRLPAALAGQAHLPSAIDEGMLKDTSKSLKAGMEVAFLGYPDIYPGNESGFPLLRTGRIASYPVGTPHSHGGFFINADVYPGDSGAPVFTSSLGGKPKLVGAITRRVGPTSQAFSHLAVAVDAKIILETLRLLESQERLAGRQSIEPEVRSKRD